MRHAVRTDAYLGRLSLLAASPSAAIALVVYLIAALLLFGEPLLHGAHRCVCIPGTNDEGIFTWSMEWWPHALLHGWNPFFTHIVYAPQGFDLAHGALTPGAALILAPVTALAGPLHSYDVAMLLSPVLAAFFAFLLCRRITAAFWPSLVGGWLFGFSTYMLGQLGSHLHMTLVFLVPAIVHLVIRALDGDIGRRPFTALLALALVAQMSFSLEVLVSLTLFGLVALAIGYGTAGPGERARLRRLFGPIAIAYGASAVIASPYLVYALKPGALPVLPVRTDKFSNDLLAYVVPTQITALGGLSFLSISHRFTAGFVEGGAYLGLPLLLMTLLGVGAGWSRAATRTLAGVLAVVLVCSLGARLHVDGSSGVPLPWAAVHRLPALGLMLPSRFVLYGALVCALISARWLARTRFRVGAWLLALLAVASLWPAVGRGFWRGTPDLPSFFTTSSYSRAIGPRDTALVLPVGIDGASMLWQAETHLGFKMASGYVVPPEASDPYKRFAIYPTLTYGAPVPDEQAAAARFLDAEHVTVAVLDPQAPNTAPWPRILRGLGWVARARDGVLLFRPGRAATAQ